MTAATRFLISAIAVHACFSSESARSRIYLAGYEPVVGSWPAGHSMILAGNQMLAGINKNADLLPDYELQVIWQNTGCVSESGLPVLYDNLLEGN